MPDVDITLKNGRKVRVAFDKAPSEETIAKVARIAEARGAGSAPSRKDNSDLPGGTLTLDNLTAPSSETPRGNMAPPMVSGAAPPMMPTMAPLSGNPAEMQGAGSAAPAPRAITPRFTGPVPKFRMPVRDTSMDAFTAATGLSPEMLNQIAYTPGMEGLYGGTTAPDFSNEQKAAAGANAGMSVLPTAAMMATTMAANRLAQTATNPYDKGLGILAGLGLGMGAAAGVA